MHADPPPPPPIRTGDRFLKYEQKIRRKQQLKLSGCINKNGPNVIEIHHVVFSPAEVSFKAHVPKT